MDVSIDVSAAQLSSKVDAELNTSLRNEINDLINRPSGLRTPPRDRRRSATGDLPMLKKTASCSSLSSNSTSLGSPKSHSPPPLRAWEAAGGYEKSASKVRSQKPLGASPLLQGKGPLLRHKFATAPPTSSLFRDGFDTGDTSRPPSRGSQAIKPLLLPEAVKTEASGTPSLQATSIDDRNSAVFWTAHEYGLDFNSCKEAAVLFTKHRKLNGALSRDEFGQLLCVLTGSESVETLPEGMLNQAFKIADNNDSGDIDFPEFACYYAAKCFSEHINCTDSEREFREISRKHGLNLIDLERYRQCFDEFDADGSGSIEEEEFQELVKKCAKVPKGVQIPETRFRHLWKECDADGSGGIDFEEFVLFYRKYFENNSGISGFEGFYRNIRPVSVP